jgi:hypothetical protein
MCGMAVRGLKRYRLVGISERGRGGRCRMAGKAVEFLSLMRWSGAYV